MDAAPCNPQCNWKLFSPDQPAAAVAVRSTSSSGDVAVRSGFITVRHTFLEGICRCAQPVTNAAAASSQSTSSRRAIATKIGPVLRKR
jgi:hypothetical protein